MVYLLELVNEEDKLKMEYIEEVYNNLDNKELGVIELIWSLYNYGNCSTYDRLRALFLAYLLEKNNIKIRLITK